MPVKGEGDLPVEQAVQDTPRVEYFKGYLGNLEKAMKEDGVVVRGYLAWRCVGSWTSAVRSCG